MVLVFPLTNWIMLVKTPMRLELVALRDLLEVTDSLSVLADAKPLMEI